MKALIGIFLSTFFSQILAFTEHPFFPFLASVNPGESDVASSNSLQRQKRDSLKENWFTQTLDHFSDFNATFQQRFFVNKAYASGSAINILWIEGAEGANPAHVYNISYPHVLNAKSLNAAVYSLEHRFYGKSQPFGNVNATSLNFLNTLQAVEDIAAFIQAQNNVSGQVNPKWILYGSFYGGSLALWTRKKYPNLSVGAVSSSAPQVPAADFYLYQKNVEDAYKNFSQSCYNNIKNSVLMMRRKMQNKAGRKELSNDFKLNPRFDQLKMNYNDKQFFYAFFAFFLQQSVQFNKVNVGPFATKGGGIADVCKIFQDSTMDDYSRMKSFVNYIVPLMTNAKKFYGLPNNYTLFVQSLKNLNPNNDYTNTRSWYWQRCNEVGYFYTTDYGADYAFGSVVPSNFWINLCSDVFGSKFGVDNLHNGVKKAKSYYGSTGATDVTNALITIGSIDPWRTVGVSSALDSSATVAIIQDFGQAADLSPTTSSDDDKLTYVRNLALKNIKKWVAGGTSLKARGKQKKFQMLKDEAEQHRLEANKNVIQNWNAEIVWNARYPQKNKPKRQKFRRHNTFSEELVHRFGSSKFDSHNKMKQGSIMQVLDHFNDSNNQGVEKWEQYFFRNNAYATDDGPTFLMMGGESAIDSAEISATYMSTLAKEFKADMYVLEHRFYGQSQPTDFDLSVKNLQYLTFDQALADAAVFVQNTKKSTGKTNNTWIVFGGSYPGMLAAWFRLKYPDLVAGAVASSAPVNAQTDAYQYMQTVDNATRFLGPKGCADNLLDFFNLLQEMLTTINGRRTLASFFDFCQSWAQDFVEPKDMQNFLAAVSNVVAGNVQYDDNEHKELNKVCNEMKMFYSELKKVNDKKSMSKSPQMKRLVRNFHAQLPSYKIKQREECWNISYALEVEYLQNEKPDQTDFRSYEWQSCLQMGISQSTDIGYSVFNSAIPTNYYTDLCSLGYGKQFTRDVLDAGQRRTNAVYGGQDNFTGTNVVFVNGSEDPWHPPSVYNPVGANNTVIFIDATSHCADMYPPSRLDPQRIKDAHKQIKAAVKKIIDK